MQKMGNKQNLKSSFPNSQSFPSSFSSSEIPKEDPINEDAQNIDSKQMPVIDLDSLLSCSLSSKQPYIKLSSQESQKLPVLFNIKTKEEDKNNKNVAEDYRPPIDLICVIDHSGSMAGAKMDLVRETLKYLVTILSPNDRLCLIIFDDKAEALTGLERVDEKNIPMFTNSISKIKHRGGTNMMLGLNKALEIIKNRKYRNKVTSLFMLSDGLDGVGHVDESFKQSLEKMSIQDVFTVNTFGFGNDHDPEVMRKLATLKDGNFYYIEKLDLVDESFVSALAGLLSVVGEKFTLKVLANTKPPFSDLRISKVYGTQWKHNEEDKSYSFTMNQLWLGISKELMLEINVPPIKKKVGDLDRNVVLLKAEVQVNSITEKKTISRELELGFTLYNEDEEIPGEEIKKVNHDVMKNYLRVQGAEVIQDARKLADQGKYDEGKKLLNQNLKEFEAEEYKADPKLQVLASDMKEIEKMCQPQEYELRGKKFMMQQEMFHVEQRCNNVSSKAYEDLYSNTKEKKMLSSLRSKKK